MKNRKEITICSKVMVVSMFRGDCGVHVYGGEFCAGRLRLLDFRVNESAGDSSKLS
jgi:hypothetical protein